MSSLISHKFHFAFIGHPSFTQVTHNLKISTLTLEEEKEKEEEEEENVSLGVSDQVKYKPACTSI